MTLLQPDLQVALQVLIARRLFKTRLGDTLQDKVRIRRTIPGDRVQTLPQPVAEVTPRPAKVQSQFGQAFQPFWHGTIKEIGGMSHRG